MAFVDRDNAGPPKTPVVMTMHRAKGMEFAKVVLIGIDDKAIPRAYHLGEVENPRSHHLRGYWPPVLPQLSFYTGSTIPAAWPRMICWPPGDS